SGAAGARHCRRSLEDGVMINTSRTIKIGNRTVGDREPVLVVAEIGVNHDGSLLRALALIESAAAAGADAVKLQIFRAQSLMHSSSQFAKYQQERVNAVDPSSMLRKFDLADRDL